MAIKDLAKVQVASRIMKELTLSIGKQGISLTIQERAPIRFTIHIGNSHVRSGKKLKKKIRSIIIFTKTFVGSNNSNRETSKEGTGLKTDMNLSSMESQASKYVWKKEVWLFLWLISFLDYLLSTVSLVSFSIVSLPKAGNSAKKEGDTLAETIRSTWTSVIKELTSARIQVHLHPSRKARPLSLKMRVPPSSPSVEAPEAINLKTSLIQIGKVAGFLTRKAKRTRLSSLTRERNCSPCLTRLINKMPGEISFLRKKLKITKLVNNRHSCWWILTKSIQSARRKAYLSFVLKSKCKRLLAQPSRCSSQNTFVRMRKTEIVPKRMLARKKLKKKVMEGQKQWQRAIALTAQLFKSDVIMKNKINQASEDKN